MEELRSMGASEARRSDRWTAARESQAAAAPLGARVVALARLAAAVHMVQAAQALAQRASTQEHDWR